MRLRALTTADALPLPRFFAAIPEDDRNFFKEDIGDPRTAWRWAEDDLRVLLVAESDDVFGGVVTVWPGVGRASHVGDLRLGVAADHRRRRFGGRASPAGSCSALRRGLTNITVEVTREQQGTSDLFLGIGFRAEALLHDHLRDPDSALHDVVLRAHLTEERWADMLIAGLDEPLS